MTSDSAKTAHTPEMGTGCFEVVSNGPDASPDLKPGERFLAGLGALLQGERDLAARWLQSTIETYDNEEYAFHARTFLTMLEQRGDWMAR